MALKELKSSIFGVFKKKKKSTGPPEWEIKIPPPPPRLSSEENKLWNEKVILMEKVVETLESLTSEEENHKQLQLKFLENEIKAKGRTVEQQTQLLRNEVKIPESLLSCPICLSVYTRKKKTPMVGFCGHTVCRSCIKAMPTEDCPICRSDFSFESPKKNFLAWDLLEHVNKSSVEEEKEGNPAPGQMIRHEFQDLSLPEDFQNINGSYRFSKFLIEYLRFGEDTHELFYDLCGGEDIFDRLSADRYDVIWWLVLSFSLSAMNFPVLQRLRQMISPSSFLYQRLRKASNNLNLWGTNRRRQNNVQSKEWEEWPEEEELPAEDVHLSPDIRQRLTLLLCFVAPFEQWKEEDPKDGFPWELAIQFFLPSTDVWG